MIAKIKENDLKIFQVLSQPISCSEVLFHDFDSLGMWDKSKFGKIRLYQYPMVSWDSLFLYDKKLSKEKNWEIKNNLAESYNLGGRLTGKSRIAIIIDFVITTFNKVYNWAVISSYDKLHVLEIFEKLINAFENHKVLKILNCHSLRSPTYKLNFDNGCLLESVNMNIASKNPGGQFFGKHVDRHAMEEASYVTKEVSGKMLMAQAEAGCINRYSGMTTFTKTSPMGEIFFDLKNRKRITNIPSYANPTWNDKKQADAIKEFGGKDSVGYQVQIEGKVVEGAECLVEGSKILLSNYTTKSIENIKVGEKLLAFSENRPRTFEEAEVLKVIDNGITEVYEIESNGKKLSLTPEHKVLAYKRRNFDWVDIKTCLERKYPILSLNHWINPDEDYYWGVLLGIIESDGSRTHRIDIDKNKKYSIYITQSKNCEWKSIEWILKVLNIKYSKYILPKDNLLRYYIPRIYIPLIEQKTKQLKATKNISFGFLAGFILGDGYYHKCGRFEICQSYKKNKSKCNLIEEICKKWDIKYYSYKRPTKGMIIYIFKRLQLFPYIEKSYKISKFRNKILQSEFRNLMSPIKLIRKYKAHVYDLTTSTKTFIAEGFLVHNSVFDIQRIRQSYIMDKKGNPITIKSFETNKDTFHRYKEIVIVEKPNNADSIGIYFDVGEGGAPSEYIIISQTNKIYKYLYRITTFQLSPDEEEQFVRYLIEVLKPNLIGIDNTSGVGKALVSRLRKDFPDNIIPVSFNENIDIEYEKDKNNQFVKGKDGSYVFKQANMVDWSMQCLKDIFYSKKIQMYEDIKFDTQINNVIVGTTKQGKKLYGYKTENHLFQAFQVFAITHWLTEFKNIKPIIRRKPGMGSFGS